MNRWRFLLGLLLTASAGAIDAVSFIRLGAIYATFMSGNTVQIGLHIASGDIGPLGGFFILVGLFMLGGFLGSMIVSTTGTWHLTLVLVFEAAALGTAFWLDLRHENPLTITAPLSLAMGAQNSLVALVRGANPATTFVTGTAFRFSEAVAARVLGRDPSGAWKLHLLVWFSFVVGAGLGTVSQLSLGTFALAPVAAGVAALAILALVTRVARGAPTPVAA